MIQHTGLQRKSKAGLYLNIISIFGHKFIKPDRHQSPDIVLCKLWKQQTPTDLTILATFKHLTTRIVFILLSGVIFYACGTEKKQPPAKSSEGRVLEYPDTLSFLQPDGTLITSLAYASAATSDERSQGLMDVRSMPGDAGMVFFFEEQDELSFWMANTPLPLDIIYVNEDGVIVSIYHNAKPFSNQNLPSGEPAKYVIETNAGYCLNYDIREGGKVQF